MTADQIRIWTRGDQLLSKETEYVQGHWPDTTEDGIKPFKSRQLELSIKMAVFSAEIEWLYHLKVVTHTGTS